MWLKFPRLYAGTDTQWALVLLGQALNTSEAHPARLTRHDTHQMGPGLFAPGLFALRLNQSRSKVEPTLVGRILTLVQYRHRRKVPFPPGVRRAG